MIREGVTMKNQPPKREKFGTLLPPDLILRLQNYCSEHRIQQAKIVEDGIRAELDLREGKIKLHAT